MGGLRTVSAVAIALALLPLSNAVAQSADDFWEPIGFGTGGLVRALTADQAGAIFAGGEGFGADFFAGWDGATWSTNSFMDFRVHSLTTTASAMWAGGGFTDFLAKGALDGSGWVSFSGGVDRVYAMTVQNGKLIAGGEKTEVPIGGFVSHFDLSTETWESSWLFSGPVNAVVVYDGELVAGGSFSTAGGFSTSNIARFDGSIWHPLGTGMTGEVRALAVYRGDLIAAGDFTTAGGITASRVARWDGSTWQPLGAGTDASVRAMVVRGDELVVGGSFSQAGTVTANGIASWRGQAWRKLGSGVGFGTVHALTVSEGDLIVGGDFLLVGGTTFVSSIARWTKPAPRHPKIRLVLGPLSLGSVAVQAVIWIE